MRTLILHVHFLRAQLGIQVKLRGRKIGCDKLNLTRLAQTTLRLSFQRFILTDYRQILFLEDLMSFLFLFDTSPNFYKFSVVIMLESAN